MTRTTRSLIVLATALASLALSVAAWNAAREESERASRLRFELRVEEIATALRGRMLDYEQALRGVVGLFVASRKVERSEWVAYVEQLDIQTSYPGIRSIAYGQLSREGAQIRVPVVFIHPADENNQRAVGFDVYSDPRRRAAMERARDTAEPVVSAPLQLRGHETDAPLSGFVMYLPVFRTGAAPPSLEARRAELVGFVYGGFRMREMLERTVGTPPGIRLRLLDVTDGSAPVSLFEQEVAFADAVRYERAEPIIVRGRTWRLEASAAPALGDQGTGDRPRLILAGGILVSILLTALVWSLLYTTLHARELARRMVAANEELERFRVAVDSHHDTLLMVDAEQMRIVYANEGACRNLGYTHDELIGQSPALIFADRDEGLLMRAYTALQRGEPAEIYRAEHRRKDGSTYPVEVSRQLVPGGRFIVGISRDISARLEAERALRESEQRLALALQSSGLALFDWDVKNGLVHLGARWNAILGGSPEPSATSIEKLEQMVHPDDLPALRERVRLLLKGDLSSYRIEHRVRNQHGEWIWIESVAEVSERDAAGRALRVTGTNGDVTERRALADMKNVFLANVSHELRTPLAGIVASLELLKEGAAGEMDPQVRTFVEMAHANGERLAELINDVLDLERSESGRLQLHIERLDAAAVLQEAAALNAAYAARYKASLRTDGGGGLFIAADPKRLQQVITNLVSNAAKFSPAGGEIRLAARAGADSRVILSVADQGPGVPADFQARMFEKFEQAKHGKGGTGLGLAICKSLVERMGGRIWCESPPGRGATLLVELPGA